MFLILYIASIYNHFLWNENWLFDPQDLEEERQLLPVFVVFLLDDDITQDDELPIGFDLPATSNEDFGLELSLIIDRGIFIVCYRIIRME